MRLDFWIFFLEKRPWTNEAKRLWNDPQKGKGRGRERENPGLVADQNSKTRIFVGMPPPLISLRFCGNDIRDNDAETPAYIHEAATDETRVQKVRENERRALPCLHKQEEGALLAISPSVPRPEVGLTCLLMLLRVRCNCCCYTQTAPVDHKLRENFFKAIFFVASLIWRRPPYFFCV